MAQGQVTTARGEVLDMDALKDAANLPLVKAKQTKTTVPPRDYKKRQPINVRGFKPAQGEHVPNLEAAERIDPEEQPQKSAVAESGEVETLADITGVKVKPTKEATARAKARLETGVSTDEATTGALSEILSDLETGNPEAIEAAEKAEGEPDVEEVAKTPARGRRTRKS